MSKGLTLLHSGMDHESDDCQNQLLGSYFSDYARPRLLDWKPISDRIILARFNSRVQKISFVQCHAPTNISAEDTKNDFHNSLCTTLKSIKKQGIVIVIVKVPHPNAIVDNTNCERYMGTQGLRVYNENGERFSKFCLLASRPDYRRDIFMYKFLFIEIYKYTFGTHPMASLETKLITLPLVLNCAHHFLTFKIKEALMSTAKIIHSLLRCDSRWRQHDQPEETIRLGEGSKLPNCKILTPTSSSGLNSVTVSLL